MKVKRLLTTACAVLCIGSVFAFPAFAAEEASADAANTQTSIVLEEGLKSGLKNGLKKGLTNGMKSGLKGGLKNGLKNGLLNGELKTK